MAIYQRVLAASPTHANALNLAGVLFMQAGRLQDAETLLRRAVQHHPQQFTFHANLAQLLLSRTQHAAALESVDRAIALSPSTARLYLLKSNILLALERQQDALHAIQTALGLDPRLPLLRRQQGEILKQLGRFAEAIPLIEQLHAEHPQDLDTLVLLGQLHSALGSPAAAQACYQRVLAINPNHVSALGNLGISLANEGVHMARARDLLMKTIQLEPESPHTVAFALADVLMQLNESELGMNLLQQIMDGKDIPAATRIQAAQNLSNTLFDTKKVKEAAAIMYEAAEIDPKNPLPWAHLAYHGMRLLPIDKAMGYAEKALVIKSDDWYAMTVKASMLSLISRADEAIKLFERSTALVTGPDLESVIDSSLIHYHYTSDFDPDRTFAAHKHWGQLATPARPYRPHTNDRNPDRKLRVGYVSPDLRDHVVATFMEPIFQHHDRENCDIYVYDSGVASGGSPDRFKNHVTQWRDVAYLDDEPLAELIRRDGIDILIDLASHTRDGRLPAFARKPAPVQITYLGYPNTSGLDRMDYRITDAIADPPGQTERWHTEKLLRLNRCAWCWRPGDAMPPEAPLAALANGYVTFGSFNNTAKINDGLLAIWGQILAAVPTAKLLIKGRAMQIPSARQRTIDLLCQAGATPDQVLGTGFAIEYQGHFGQIARADIALDTYPYTGTTTTMEMLYLGLPVITLQGVAHVSRVSSSLLHAIGIPELIATTRQQYIDLAVALASDLPRINNYRKTLRQRLMSSPVVDGKDMASAFDTALRQVWRQWCSSPA